MSANNLVASILLTLVSSVSHAYDTEPPGTVDSAEPQLTPEDAAVVELAADGAQKAAPDSSDKPSPVVESYGIEPNVKVKKGQRRLIGDYAEVRLECCGLRQRGNKEDHTFGLDIVTPEGESISLKGKIHSVYHEIGTNEPGFFSFLFEEFLDHCCNIEPNDEPDQYVDYYDAYKRNITATMAAGHSEGEAWQLVAEEQWTQGAPLNKVGTITNGVQALQLTRQESLDIVVENHEDGEWRYKKINTVVEIHENDQWLSRKINDERYEFLAGIDPGLKLVLLAGMEVFQLDEFHKKFWGRFHSESEDELAETVHYEPLH